ncbi:hypothetical protein TNCT_375751 [Trichonephila clavata]|uniref:Uncharacterized protein n=1 Tax=Trichonephila clavata TaxID=2740835 RepID=A0A8X6FRN4_TRICU|nr:hypothetical protein TNCT_375751 [Trichonephila clavata]
MTPPYVRFTQRFLPYTRYFSRFPHVVSTFALHVESWGASRRPHRGPSAFTVPLWPSLSNRKRLSFYSPRLPTVGRLKHLSPMIENPLFSNDPRLSDSCPTSPVLFHLVVFPIDLALLV